MTTACENTDKADIGEVSRKIKYESTITTFEHPETKQKYKIVNAYKLYQNYLDEVKKDPDAPYLDIYQEEVIDPIYSDCFEDGEFLHMADLILNADPNHLNVSPTHLTEIQNLIDKIDNQQPEKTIKEALIKSSDLLPSEKETTVCVLPSTNKYAEMITVGTGKIEVLYNWQYTEDTLRAGLAHEYHHSIWAEKHLDRAKQSSVLDNLIFEGKAVMFEKNVYPDIDFTPIDPSYDKELWSKIEPDLLSYDFNRSREILMGGKDLPWLYGYSEGYKMVKSYLELNPNAAPAEWTGVSPQDIFEKGNYVENYQ
ncbi:Zn-dependent protease [Bacillus enclensis]|nr:Zn-dependent protease [[Bacillus] enclensis]